MRPAGAELLQRIVAPAPALTAVLDRACVPGFGEDLRPRPDDGRRIEAVTRASIRRRIESQPAAGRETEQGTAGRMPHDRTLAG
jgi:hypothetical protein